MSSLKYHKWYLRGVSWPSPSLRQLIGDSPRHSPSPDFATKFSKTDEPGEVPSESIGTETRH